MLHTVGTLLNHQWIAYEIADKQYPVAKVNCDTCNTSFIFLQGLQSVTTVGLQGQQPFCHLCNRGFRNIKNLNQHTRSVHQGIYRYRCTYCTKGFNARKDLQGHIATHTGVREFKCNLCGKEFAYKQGFHTHLRLHEMNLKKLQDQ